MCNTTENGRDYDDIEIAPFKRSCHVLHLAYQFFGSEIELVLPSLAGFLEKP
jgi:hypothetical protein